MYDTFLDYLSGLLARPITPEEEEIIRQTFKPRKLRKHQFFLQEGEVCKSAGFVVKGALKQYTIDEAGKENILSLFIENYWAGDRESFAQDTPSLFNIDAYEETEMLVVFKADFQDKLAQQPFIADLMRILSERQALHLLKRVHSTQTLTAEQRFADFEKNYPHLLQRFPQHIIASYLGMTKETLSRIRATSLKK